VLQQEPDAFGKGPLGSPESSSPRERGHMAANDLSVHGQHDLSSAFPPTFRDKVFWLRLIIGGIAGLVAGIGLLLWELSGSAVTAWGITHPILLIVCCIGLLIAAIWMASKS